MKKILLLLVLVLGVSQLYENTFSSMTGNTPSSTILDSSTTEAHSSYICDGRQYCSQMTSRDEAEFFIRNCPNTKMDGDGDGIPCENDSRW